jgi:hypothetical protein
MFITDSPQPPPPAAATDAGDDSDVGVSTETQSSEEEEVEEEGPESAEVELDLEEVVRVWPAVLDKLRETSPALAATFEGARPVGMDREDSTLTVGFPPASTFNKRKAEDAEKRDQVAAAFETVTGERLRPVYVLLDGEAVPDAAPEEEKVDEEELVERMKSEFDAEEVS